MSAKSLLFATSRGSVVVKRDHAEGNMNYKRHLAWGRVFLAALGAVLFPVFLLVAIVFVYGFMRQADSPTPEAFAPIAGAWVGPIGGFLATLPLAYWAARHGEKPVWDGLAVGGLSVLLDHAMGVLLSAPFQMLFVFSYAGRIMAGLIGGWLVPTRVP